MHLVAGRPEAAAPLFAQAIDRQPRTLAARFGLGRAALAQQDYAAAASHFEGVLTLEARAVNVHYPLALAYRGLGDNAKAEAHLRQRGDFEILPADPLMEELREVLRSAISYEVRGTRALNGGDWKTAVAEFRLGLELEPSNPTLKHKLGTALHMLGDERGAREAFEDIVRTSPEYVRAHYSLGVLLESAGRHQEAIAHYSAAVAREPGYLEARLRLAELMRPDGPAGAGGRPLRSRPRTRPPHGGSRAWARVDPGPARAVPRKRATGCRTRCSPTPRTPGLRTLWRACWRRPPTAGSATAERRKPSC